MMPQETSPDDVQAAINDMKPAIDIDENGGISLLRSIIPVDRSLTLIYLGL